MFSFGAAPLYIYSTIFLLLWIERGERGDNACLSKDLKDKNSLSIMRIRNRTTPFSFEKKGENGWGVSPHFFLFL